MPGAIATTMLWAALVVACAGCFLDTEPQPNSVGGRVGDRSGGGDGDDGGGDSAGPGTGGAQSGPGGDGDGTGGGGGDGDMMAGDGDSVPPTDAGLQDASMGFYDLPSCRGFVPTGGACPPACTRCDDAQGLCHIECTGLGTCSNTQIVCPPGWSCRITCSGLQNCSNVTIMCADGPCNVICEGGFVCSNMTLLCGDDACRVACDPLAGGGANLTFSPGNSCGTHPEC